jgi:hypothetical protein
MNRVLIIVFGGCLLYPLQGFAQQALPDAPRSRSSSTLAPPLYSFPTQGERFKTYIKQTYGISSILEAGTRGGIDQARDRPREWPEGAHGYADRFGSALGQIAIRNTTEYVVGAIFREDLRFIPCASACAESSVKRALEDTFTARRGNDGHRTFSVARFAGPITGAVVANNSWYPAGYGTSEVVRQAGFSYAFGFIRNYIRELTH